MISINVGSRTTVPVEAVTKEIRERSFKLFAKDLGIYEAELEGPVNVPDNLHAVVKICLPEKEVVVDGRFDVEENGKVRVKFLNLDTATKVALWSYLRRKVAETRACPYCKGPLRPRQEMCEHCGMYVNVESEQYLEVCHNQLVSLRILMLEEAVDRFNREMEEIERSFALKERDEGDLLREVTAAIHRVCDVCRDLEDVAGVRSELVKSKQEWFRKETYPFLSQSYFIDHAITWPRGYPGDYEILEGIYRNVPLSVGLGYLLDLYFLSTTLAVAVKERLATLREMLRAELKSRNRPRVLDIACGSSREVFELAPEIGASGAKFTCIDFDSDSLSFSSDRMSYTTVFSQVAFRKYNALRMVNSKKNIREFGYQDIIYSTGLFDYLTDDVLIRMLKAIYEMISPGGKLIASFKDCNRYRTQPYHWIGKWDAFYQRTESDCLMIFEKTGLPLDKLRISREKTGVIMFFVLER